MNEELIAKLENKANEQIDAALRWREEPPSAFSSYFYGVAVGKAVATLDAIWDAITPDPNCPAAAAWERVNSRAKKMGVHL